MGEVIVAMKGIVKTFGGTHAVNRVDFVIESGEVHALLGGNGAGKSTLIKVLAGVHAADAGEILVHGRPVDPRVDTLPIAFIHQDLGLIEWMTVAENVGLARGFARSARLRVISTTSAPVVEPVSGKQISVCV